MARPMSKVTVPAFGCGHQAAWVRARGRVDRSLPHQIRCCHARRRSRAIPSLTLSRCSTPTKVRAGLPQPRPPSRPERWPGPATVRPVPLGKHHGRPAPTGPPCADRRPNFVATSTVSSNFAICQLFHELAPPRRSLAFDVLAEFSTAPLHGVSLSLFPICLGSRLVNRLASRCDGSRPVVTMGGSAALRSSATPSPPRPSTRAVPAIMRTAAFHVLRR